MPINDQTPALPPPHLPLWQWYPHNHAALCAFLAAAKAQQASLAAQAAQAAQASSFATTAAFDWDDTCIFGDIGTAAFVYQLDTLTLRLAPHVVSALWQGVVDQVEAAEQRQSCQNWLDDVCAAYAVLWPLMVAGKQADWHSGPAQGAHQDFRVKLARLVALLSHTGCATTTQAAYAGMAAMWAGFSQSAVADLVPAIVRHAEGLQQQQQPWRQASLGAAGAWTQQLPPVPRPYAEMRALFAALTEAGVGVWVVSASLQALVQGAASLWQYPCPPQQIIGMRLAQAPGADPAQPLMLPRMLTDAPITYRQGKSDAIAKHLPVPPALVAGDAMTDFEMLTHSSVRLRLLLHRPPHAAPMAALFAQAWQANGQASCPQTLAQGHDARTGTFIPAQRSSPSQTRNAEQMP